MSAFAGLTAAGLKHLSGRELDRLLAEAFGWTFHVEHPGAAWTVPGVDRWRLHRPDGHMKASLSVGRGCQIERITEDGAWREYGPEFGTWPALGELTEWLQLRGVEISLYLHPRESMAHASASLRLPYDEEGRPIAAATVMRRVLTIGDDAPGAVRMALAMLALDPVWFTLRQMQAPPVSDRRLT